MMTAAPLEFKIATEPAELEGIHRLNYETFVEEIPQHPANPDGALVDKFDRENTYVICRQGSRLVGMVAVRGERPFSLDQKLPDLDRYLPPGRHLCEIRLLAIERRHRRGAVLRGLISLLANVCLQRGYDCAVISGTVRELGMYRRLGFRAFGPRVGTPEALYQPMYLTREAFEASGKALVRMQAPANLLPGPVGVRREVREALGAAPVSHRSERFLRAHRDVADRLCALLGCRYAQILLGSGTLANDVVAAQLGLLPPRGLVLSNGEFGERLVDHATRSALEFDVLRAPWGETFCRDEVSAALGPGVRWLWAVHCETSTGVLNDLEFLAELCAARGVKLCADCISSIGTMPVDLSRVFLATGVSGKGLGGMSGLSMVFHNHAVEPNAAIPRYLDLGLYAANAGVPFTASSNLLAALGAALDTLDAPERFDRIGELAGWLRARLRKMSLQVVAPSESAAAAVTTIALPAGVSSESVGARLEEAGYLISYRSGYLLERNWVQICLMGECSRAKIAPLLSLLSDLCGRPSTGPGT
jgi:aspartate aminotransferase-like enzyme/N-acyl-L-homoserine lactone synthetase